MTEKQFLEKINEMLPDLNRLILEKANKVFSSGAIEPLDYEDDFLLPKIFMSAMGSEIKWKYGHYLKGNVQVRNNLNKFL